MGFEQLKSIVLLRDPPPSNGLSVNLLFSAKYTVSTVSRKNLQFLVNIGRNSKILAVVDTIDYSTVLHMANIRWTYRLIVPFMCIN